MTNPFSNELGLTTNAELLSWLATSAKLEAAGIISGQDPVVIAQRATVEAEATVRRLIGGPARLTRREQREANEGQE